MLKELHNDFNACTTPGINVASVLPSAGRIHPEKIHEVMFGLQSPQNCLVSLCLITKFLVKPPLALNLTIRVERSAVYERGAHLSRHSSFAGWLQDSPCVPATAASNGPPRFVTEKPHSEKKIQEDD